MVAMPVRILEHLVVARRPAVVAGGRHDRQVESACHVVGEAVPQLPEQLGAPDLEEPEIARVVHDPHRIAVGEEYAVARDRPQRERADCKAYGPSTPARRGTTSTESDESCYGADMSSASLKMSADAAQRGADRAQGP